MPKTTEVSQPAQGFLSHPVFTPAKIVLTPVTWALYKVASVFQSSIGYFVRIGVFSFGEWHRSWVKNTIIEVYSGGIGGLFCSRFSTDRLEKGFTALTNIGGIRTPTLSKDGTQLDTMLIRASDVMATIANNGGKFVESLPISPYENYFEENRYSPDHYVDVIIPKKNDEQWQSFCKETLGNLGLERTVIRLRSGEIVEAYITNHWDDASPVKPKKGQCFVRCNSPTESYPMAKRDIMRRTFLGQDVLCFDYRGTWKSEGVPSEGGYYLDAETMVEKAVHDYGYAWSDIWAEGFCLGGAVATHLKRKYHDEGINLFVQNTFGKMRKTLDAQVFPASHIAPLGMKGLQSQDPSVEELVEEDGFDSVGKLESLEEKKGTTLVVNTDTDRIVHEDSHETYAEAAEKASAVAYRILYCPLDREKDGHRLDVFSDRETWQQAVAYIAEKDAGIVRRLWNLIPGG